jgi:sugar phosphate isomerase/epimerase
MRSQIQSRREFIRSASKAGLAAGVASIFPRMASADAMGLPPGIQLYSVRDNFAKDIPGTLKQLRDIGFREVETAGFGSYSAKEFRKLLDDAGLKAPSAHLKLTPATIDSLLADANALGATFATSSSLETALHPPAPAPASGPRPAMAPFGADEFKRLAAVMNELGAKAKAAGLQYAYHNHNYEFEKVAEGELGYDILVNETDHELVKFEIDCGWMCAAGADPVNYMKKYPGRIRMLHIKEFQTINAPTTDLYGPGRPKGTDLGQGFIDYKRIFAEGKKAGIQHAFSEQEDPFPVSQMDSARSAYKFLHAAS